MESTLVIIKPDCIRRGMIGAFITALESTGLKIKSLIMRQLKHEEASELYKEHRGKWHFDRNIKHMTSAPVVIIEAQGQNAVLRAREIVQAFRENHRDVVCLPQNLVHATSDLNRIVEELSSVGLLDSPILQS